MMTYTQNPVMIVNFKTYSEATGQRALELSKGLEKIRKDTGIDIIVAAQMTDILLISQQIEIPVFAQHVDPEPQGAHTGRVTPEAVKAAGGRGTLLNHSERRLKLATIDETVRRVRSIGLTSVVCANNASVGAAIAALGPDFVAVEPPELIGTGVAVSKAKPEVVTDTVALIRRANPRVSVLCGAGITDGRDASSALRLGAHGILVSSGVVRAREPLHAALDLAQSMRSAV